MNEKNNADKISLKELILKIQGLCGYLFSKWYIIIIVIIVGGALGILYAQKQKAIFVASTTFVLESADGGGSGMGQVAGLAALAGVDLGQSGGGIFQGDNLFELYRSRKMIESALLLPSASNEKMLLLDRYLALSNEREKWKNMAPELLKINFALESTPEIQRLRDSVLQKVVQNINKSNLEVGKLDKKSSIIKVDVKSGDEVFSKEFNNALVAQVNDFYVKTKTKKSLDIIDATPNLNPTRQAKRLIPTQRSQFSAETNRAILGQLVQNLEMSKMALLKDTPLIQVVDQPIYPLQVIKASKMKYLVLGCVLTFFLCTVILLGIKLFRDIMSN